MPFLIASLPATPAPTTETSRACMFSKFPKRVPMPLFGLRRKYCPTTKLILPAILLIGANNGRLPSLEVTVS